MLILLNKTHPKILLSPQIPFPLILSEERKTLIGRETNQFQYCPRRRREIFAILKLVLEEFTMEIQ